MSGVRSWGWVFMGAILVIGCSGREESTAESGTETGGGASSGTEMNPSSSSGSSFGSSSGTSSGSTASGSDAEASTGADDTETTGELSVCMGELPRWWQDGTDCAAEVSIQVHRHDDDTFILRQSLCTSFEGPFMYLLFGEDRVLLEDTGHGGIPIGQVVYDIIDEWLAENGRTSIELVVVNSHAHGDHMQGNPSFMGQPNTTFVAPSVAELSAFFEIESWPDDIAQFDLGGRTIEVIPIPGHQQAHIALWDASRGLLLTGDTLYPGRLYISDFSTYAQSIHRLVDHLADREVCRVLGTHIEMTNAPGVDYPFGAQQHPDEHPLELGFEHLVELRDALDAMVTPQIQAHDHFIIYPL
jgi:hydroxyacylglutathione hydrolase